MKRHICSFTPTVGSGYPGQQRDIQGDRMTVNDVRDIVEAAETDPSLHSFESEHHASLHLLTCGQTWRVFISERGQLHEKFAGGAVADRRPAIIDGPHL